LAYLKTPSFSDTSTILPLFGFFFGLDSGFRLKSAKKLESAPVKKDNMLITRSSTPMRTKGMPINRKIMLIERIIPKNMIKRETPSKIKGPVSLFMVLLLHEVRV